MSSPSIPAGKVQEHLRLLRILSLASRILTAIALYSLAQLPLFDSSPNIASNKSPLLRWDAFHFTHIAHEGYVHDYEWAFFPGTPVVMRLTGRIIHWLKKADSGPLSWDDLLQGGALAALVVDSTTTLYHLTLHHFKSCNIALMVSLLSLIPSSPAVMRFASYTEPFFTYFSYQGMLFCAQSRWLGASICFALAGTFKSNGILLSGFILWGLIIQPFLDQRQITLGRLFYATLLTATTFTPFIYHHVSAYVRYCILDTDATSSELPEWCSNVPPSIYTHVQSKYWNNGFLRYWTLQQLPNFLISLPIYLSLLAFSVYHIRTSLVPRLGRLSQRESRPLAHRQNTFLSPSITPHAIYALILTLTLFLTQHVQIMLRVASSMPFVYWSAAWLIVQVKEARWGRWWVGWSTVWGAVSLVLWACFLPPA